MIINFEKSALHKNWLYKRLRVFQWLDGK